MENKILQNLNIEINSCEQQILPHKTVLLEEGDIAKNLYFIEKGCLRLYFYNEGKDITFQFFFEESMVASFESMYNEQPSIFSLESIEATTVRVIRRDDFLTIISKTPNTKHVFEDILLQRLYTYQKLFLSRIKNSPQQRYEELISEYPHILQRVPQHYIASYLGITPVSLSRIRNRRT